MNRPLSLSKYCYYSVLLSSIFLFSGCTNLKTEECSPFENLFPDFINELIAAIFITTESTLVIKEPVQINYIFEKIFQEFIAGECTELSCNELTSTLKNVKVVPGSEINPEVFSRYTIIELIRPFYCHKNKSIKILCTLYCGNDCGSVDLYELRIEENKWKIREIKGMAVM